MGKQQFDSFISNMIRHASVGESPDYVLNELVQYVGKTLGADRAYIFEANHDNTFTNTYEWCNDGITPEIDNLQSVPYEGVLDIWYEQFKTRHNVIIYDVEEYKNVSIGVYNYLKPQNIQTLVAGPITIGGKYDAFFGVDNPPIDNMELISSIIEEVECVLSMVIRMRNYTKIIQKSAVTDGLTGCQNRAALAWAYNENFRHDDSISILMCDLNGLKKKNDIEGHIAGNRYICDMADALVCVFGKQQVFRLGGDEFVVVSLGQNKVQIEEKVDMLRKICNEKAVSVSIGLEHREKADESFELLLHKADEKMYIEKKNYYKSIEKNNFEKNKNND